MSLSVFWALFWDMVRSLDSLLILLRPLSNWTVGPGRPLAPGSSGSAPEAVSSWVSPRERPLCSCISPLCWGGARAVPGVVSRATFRSFLPRPGCFLTGLQTRPQPDTQGNPSGRQVGVPLIALLGAPREPRPPRP